MLIIFDLDDTLIDTSGCVTPIQLEKAVDGLLERGAPIADRGRACEMLLRLDATAPSARHAMAEFLEIHGIDVAYLEGAVRDIYDSLSPDIEVVSLDGAVDLLLELSLVHRLAIVTLGKREQQLMKLEKAGIDSTIFSKIIVSEQRDKKYHYQAIIDEFSLTPSEVLVCGDRIAIDLAPAKQLGCTTVHMRWGRGLHASGNKQDVDYAISRLPEIKEILTKVTSVAAF